MGYGKLMGATAKRQEDPRPITGQGQDVRDLRLPGLLHVAFVRSPYAHARVLGVDPSAALARSGVVAVITGEDIRAECRPMPMGSSGETAPTEGEISAETTHY